MIIVSIDTSQQKLVKLELAFNGNIYVTKREKKQRSSQDVLPQLKDLLYSHNITVEDIDGIMVNEGPGSFTGIRVGVAVANALSFALNIPVNNNKILVEPKYSA